MKNIGFSVILSGVLLGALPCTAAVTVGEWQPIYCGVAYATGSDGAQMVKAMRIDLQAPGIEFYATPHTGSQDTTTQKTSTFLVDNGLQVAINANLYRNDNNFAVFDTDVSGLHVSRGTVVSAANVTEQRCVLRITAGNVASFDYVNSTPYDTAGIHTAVSGYGFCLTAGVPGTDTNSTANRTVAGLSADGRFLILATLTLATHKACGEWLLRFGSYNGLNLDGGGSTTLVRSNGAGGSTLLQQGSLGERYVGSHLGVYATNQPAPFTVTFDPQGGAVSPTSATVTNGRPYGAVPTPTRAAYTFRGWSTGLAGTGLAVTSATVVASSSNHTLYAQWVGTPYTVTFDAQGGSVSPGSATVTNGLAYGPLPTPIRANYTFGGWWTGAGGAGTPIIATTTVEATGDLTVYAKWDAIPVVAAFDASTSTGRVPVTVTFADHSTGTVTNRYWDFGDGTWTNTTSTSVSHGYTNGGVYTVTLTVSGPLGSDAMMRGGLVVAYGFFPNAIPYQLTFEPPGMQAGDSLFVPWNTNGWYGDPADGAVVTNVTYAWPAADYPVPAAPHAQVLAFREASLMNLFAPAAGPCRAVVDVMIKPRGNEMDPPDTNTLGNTQVAVFADTNGHLNAWCSGDQEHTNRMWVTFPDTYIGPTNWGRVTLALDYTSDQVKKLTYVSAALNGIVLPVPGGLGYAYAGGTFVRSTNGTWLVSANPTARQVSALRLNGSGHLDDLVVTTNALPFLSFPESALYVWLAAHGWTNEFDTAVQGDPDGDGAPTREEYWADTDPTNAQSKLAITAVSFTNGDICVAWQGGVDARQVLQCRSDLADPSDQWQALFTNTPPTLIANAHTVQGVTNRSLYYRIQAGGP